MVGKKMDAKWELFLHLNYKSEWNDYGLNEFLKFKEFLKMLKLFVEMSGTQSV